ncbi:MAG: DUF4038 domain-containing protein [Bacteroidetes bacterium]|nr:MAG: DUF4038 domain-containing protein [Bacteroidota bacterium]
MGLPVLTAQPTGISADRRHLTDASGRPFLWLGDTAWELFHILDVDEATHYLETRARQGFTVIQAVILAENDGLRRPNANGDVPLENLDPTRPVEAYFQHVDRIVEKATQLGLTMALLPTWGDKLETNHPGAGPVIFTPENARIYGEFLGARYRAQPVVWVLGGDRNVDSEENLAIWRAMAEGLRAGDGGRHLITYHPRGASTSAYFLHREPWLDFNMYQSGHGQRKDLVFRYNLELAQYQPEKPFLNGEPAYEDIPVRFWDYLDWSDPQRTPAGVLDEDGLIVQPAHFEAGFFEPLDVRVSAYWSLLSGACGHTYGHNAVWQMYKPGQPLAIPTLTDWREALARPGAEDIRHLHDLLASRPWGRLQPRQDVLYGLNPPDGAHLRAAVDAEGSFLLVYAPGGRDISLRLEALRGERVVAWWFNPRNGATTYIETLPAAGIHTFALPEGGPDWVLVVDAAGAGFGPPGTRR